MVSRTNGVPDGKYRSKDYHMKNDLNDMQAGTFPAEAEQSNVPAELEGDASTLLVANIMNQLMRPLLEDIGKLLKNNTEAMERIAASQDVIQNRMEALEKQVRLNTPVTDKQARYLADKARDKARELLEKKESGLSEDKKAVTKLAGLIKKDVMMRNGVGSLREIPRCEYSVTMSQIEIWNNALALFDIVKEARKRKEAEAAKDAE